MRGLLAAEWLKLTRRPLVWVLLGVFLGLLVVQQLTQFGMVLIFGAVERESGSGVAAQIDEWRRRSAFPGIFGAVLTHVNGLGGVFAIILTAAAMGNEYSWGTLRTQLARRPDRASLLLAKLAALVGLVSAATLLALGVGAAVGGALAALAGRPGALAAADLAALPAAGLRAVYVLVPYITLTLCFTVLGRSLLAGIGGGLLYLVFEVGFGALALFQVLGGAWRQLYNLTIGQNINALTIANSHAFGLRPELVTAMDVSQLPPAPQAALVIAVYSALFLATAVYAIRSRDVSGPS